MTANKLFLSSVLLLLCQLISAQNDSIVALREVVVSDLQLQQYSTTLAFQKLKDSIIERNSSSLTSLLQYNSVIYFKQNGLGMVSSPSFRGSTAQQTAVVWNGININSQFTGLTDFNTVTTRDFENVTVRAGGGSVLYGSGAIGGSIHLNNELHFDNEFQNALTFNVGSFNTYDTNYKAAMSNDKFATTVSISRNSSTNDYEYVGTDGKRNENGQFANTSMSASAGYRLDKRNIFKFYSQFYSSERHFSGTIASISRSKYEDYNTRSLLDWTYTTQNIRSSVKVAFLSEQYKYFPTYWLDDFESSRAETIIAKYLIHFRLSDKWLAEAVAEYNEVHGVGSSIGSNSRGISSGSVMAKYTASKKLQLESSLRQEVTDDYQSPLLYSVGLTAPLSKHYRLKLNHSKNFRIPTFNDLYWVSGGNADLKPEESTQTELGQEVSFKRLKVIGTVYYNRITDMIQWRPITGIWSPENVGDVESYGAELLIEASKKIGVHLFNLTSTYAYTVAKNMDLNTPLTYVPSHKYNANFSYSINNFSFSYQYLFNGPVYTLNDNETQLEGYKVSNVGLFYYFGKMRQSSFGMQSLNCWNESYESVPDRPLPGRNFQLNLIIKF